MKPIKSTKILTICEDGLSVETDDAIYIQEQKQMSQQVKFDHTRPVQTREGRKARILAFDIRGNWPLVAAVSDRDSKSEYVYSYQADGRISAHGESIYDLVNIPMEAVGYVNVYQSAPPGSGKLYGYGVYDSAAAADRHASSLRVGRVRVGLREGQFDE